MTKKEQRIFIYNKFGGRCAYCGCELNGTFHVDEIEPVLRNQVYVKDEHGKRVWSDIKGYYKTKVTLKHPERVNIENQNPACPSCNVNKRDLSLEGFRSFIADFVKSLNRYSVQYKVAKRYGLIQETEKPVVFYFETFKPQKNGD